MSNLTDLNKKNINDIIKKVIKLKIPVLLVPVDCDYNDHYPMRPKTQAKLKKKSKSKIVQIVRLNFLNKFRRL